MLPCELCASNRHVDELQHSDRFSSFNDVFSRALPEETRRQPIVSRGARRGEKNRTNGIQEPGGATQAGIGQQHVERAEHENAGLAGREERAADREAEESEKITTESRKISNYLEGLKNVLFKRIKFDASSFTKFTQ